MGKERIDMTPEEKFEDDWYIEMHGIAVQIITKWGKDAVLPLGKMLDGLPGMWKPEGKLLDRKDMETVKTAALKVLETGKLEK